MPLFPRGTTAGPRPSEHAAAPLQKIRAGCPAHNCGGRCVLVAHVRDGRIVRLDADDRPDDLAAPQLRACVRGRAYLRRQYHPDRLMTPLKRIGWRGEGRFAPTSWDDAIDIVARELQRVKARCGRSTSRNGGPRFLATSPARGYTPCRWSGITRCTACTPRTTTTTGSRRRFRSASSSIHSTPHQGAAIRRHDDDARQPRGCDVRGSASLPSPVCIPFQPRFLTLPRLARETVRLEYLFLRTVIPVRASGRHGTRPRCG